MNANVLYTCNTDTITQTQLNRNNCIACPSGTQKHIFQKICQWSPPNKEIQKRMISQVCANVRQVNVLTYFVTVAKIQAIC